MPIKKITLKMTEQQQRDAFISKAKELGIDQTEEGFANLISDLVRLKTHAPVVPVTSTLSVQKSDEIDPPS